MNSNEYKILSKTTYNGFKDFIMKILTIQNDDIKGKWRY